MALRISTDRLILEFWYSGLPFIDTPKDGVQTWINCFCVERFRGVYSVGKAREEGILIPLEISLTFVSSKREVDWSRVVVK